MPMYGASLPASVHFVSLKYILITHTHSRTPTAVMAWSDFVRIQVTDPSNSKPPAARSFSL